MSRSHPQEYREIAFSAWGEQCYIRGCGVSEGLEVHHCDGDRRHNLPLNLVPLCKTHHHAVHSPDPSETPPRLVSLREMLPDEKFHTGPESTISRERERKRVRLFADQVRWMEENNIKRAQFIREAIDKKIERSASGWD